VARKKGGNVMRVRLFVSEMHGKKVYYTILGGVPIIFSSSLVLFDEILEENYVNLPIRARVYYMHNYVYIAPGDNSVVYFFKADYPGSKTGVINKVEGGEFVSIASGNDDDPYDEAIIVASPQDKIEISWSDEENIYWYDWNTVLQNGQEESHCLTEIEVTIG